MNLTKFYGIIVFSIILALPLAILQGSPALAIREITGQPGLDSAKQIEDGVITDMTRDIMYERLQNHLNSPRQTKISKNFIDLNNRFDSFPADAKIDLTLRDVEVPSILRILAKEGNMNIVIDESVMGFISAELKNISLNEAMEIILTSEELEARVANNTIFVASRPAMTKKGLDRRYIRTFKLNNSNSVYIAGILRASVFNKGYKVKEEDAGKAMATFPAPMPAVPSEVVPSEGQPAGSSTGQSNLIDSKTIKGEVEALEPGENFGNSGKLASTIKVQHYIAKTKDINIDNNDGGAIVIPDTRTNSILVAGLKRDILLAEEAIEYLDRPLKQVSIEVSLIELNQDDTKNLGLTVSSQGGKTGGVFNGSFTDHVFSATSSQTALTLNTISSIADEVAVKLEALIRNEDAKLLANPQIIALDGSESLIKITEQVVSSVETTITQTTTTYSAEVSDVGIVLNILPKIGDNDHVTMRIRPSITSSLPEVLIGEFGDDKAAIRITPISTREVILQDVRVKSGETLAIAGLVKEKDTEKVGKVPLLGDLPVLGALFRNTEFGHEKSELIILITPTVIDDVARL